MVKEINPKDTKREAAFDYWKSAAMPMTTICKTLDVSRLISVSQKHKYRFNMMMCWCVSRAAAQMEEFYTLPVGEVLMKYDSLAIGTVVKTLEGNICTCDIPLCYSLDLFSREYLTLTRHVQNTGTSYNLNENYMVVDTTPLIDLDMDGIQSAYSPSDNNPCLVWGKFRRRFFKTVLPISFRFHHTQMDESHAAMFLNFLQQEINKVTPPPLPTSTVSLSMPVPPPPEPVEPTE